MNDGTYHEPELANPRVSYAVHFENDGPSGDRRAAAAGRAARAMRDGNRNMDGTAQADHPHAGRKAPGAARRSPALTDLTVAPSKSVPLLRALFRERALQAHLAWDAKGEALWRAREQRVREIEQEASHAAGQWMRAGPGASPGLTIRITSLSEPRADTERSSTSQALAAAINRSPLRDAGQANPDAAVHRPEQIGPDEPVHGDRPITDFAWSVDPEPDPGVAGRQLDDRTIQIEHVDHLAADQDLERET